MIFTHLSTVKELGRGATYEKVWLSLTEPNHPQRSVLQRRGISLRGRWSFDASRCANLDRKFKEAEIRAIDSRGRKLGSSDCTYRSESKPVSGRPCNGVQDQWSSWKLVAAELSFSMLCNLQRECSMEERSRENGQ